MPRVFLCVLGLVFTLRAGAEIDSDAIFRQLYEKSGLHLPVDESGLMYENFNREFKKVTAQAMHPFHRMDYARQKAFFDNLFAGAIPASNSDMVERINRVQSSWKAEVSPRFKEMSLKAASRLMGFKPSAKRMPSSFNTQQNGTSNDIPDNFKVAERWPECATIVNHIRDQAHCGSCWAFGTVEAFEDRVCIDSKGAVKPLLSVQQLTTCCTECGYGCNGGDPGAAWDYISQTGLVSGGDYQKADTGDSCQPYNLPQCSHHVHSTKYPSCDQETADIGHCAASSCTDQKFPKSFAQDLHFAKDIESLDTVQQAQESLMSKGSITATLSVYEDLISYKSGIYKQTSGTYLGGHAVKIVGWGKENGTSYWIVNNSWNEEWGDNGTFKIAFGECEIDDGLVAGSVKATNTLVHM